VRRTLELVSHADFWLAVVTIGSLIFYLGGDLLRPIAARVGQLRAAMPRAATPRTEIAAKEDESVSEDVSGIETPESDPEMIAIRAIAKLIAADLVKETPALEQAFGVKAGSGKDYKRVQKKLKEAMQEKDRQLVNSA